MKFRVPGQKRRWPLKSGQDESNYDFGLREGDRPLPAPKILAFAGSTREASYNKRLIKIAADGRDAGAQVTLIDLAEYRLPLFDEDLEARDGLHPAARLLKELFISHQGLLISSPEYNSSITAVLKNTIDWVSRPVDGQPPLNSYTGKVVTLMALRPVHSVACAAWSTCVRFSATLAAWCYRNRFRFPAPSKSSTTTARSRTPANRRVSRHSAPAWRRCYRNSIPKTTRSPGIRSKF